MGWFEKTFEKAPRVPLERAPPSIIPLVHSTRGPVTFKSAVARTWSHPPPPPTPITHTHHYPTPAQPQGETFFHFCGVVIFLPWKLAYGPSARRPRPTPPRATTASPSPPHTAAACAPHGSTTPPLAPQPGRQHSARRTPTTPTRVAVGARSQNCCVTIL